MRPLLYIGIDGVLTGRYGNPPLVQWRPHTASFLHWAKQEFHCRWLTTWPPTVTERLPALMNDPCFKLAQCEFVHHQAEGLERDLIRLKSHEIQWWWLGAELDPLDWGWLDQHQHRSRHIKVDKDGASSLDAAVRELCKRADVPPPLYLTLDPAAESLAVLDAIYATLRAQPADEPPDWKAMEEQIERLARRVSHTLPDPAGQPAELVAANEA